jgi:cytoskeletal protein CcmA (bactofilin family)
LTFDGKIEGEIQTNGTLHLGNNAVINGNINAQNVVVRGKIKGNVVANDKIEIKANTELFGDISASKLAMEEGVTFVGRTEIKPKKVAPVAGPPPLRPNTRT